MTDATASPATAAVVAPKPGSPEYNTAMIAKAQGSRITQNGVDRVIGAAPSEPAASTVAATQVTATAAPAPVTAPAPAVTPSTVVKAPEGTPQKFLNADGSLNAAALIKSYSEAEKVITSRQAAAAPAAAVPSVPAAATPVEGSTPAPTASAPTTAVTPVATTATTAPAEPAAPALTFETVQNTATTEYAKDGKLSESTYESFLKIGVPKTAVDAYIGGMQAQTNAYLGQIYSASGSKEAYDSMVKWAQVNYSPAEQAAFDGTLRSMDAGQMTLAVNGLKARFAAANGTSGQLLTPAPGGATTGDSAFTSQAEMIAAMRDPKYSKDAAFRAEVARKVNNARRQGINLGINGYKTQIN